MIKNNNDDKIIINDSCNQLNNLSRESLKKLFVNNKIEINDNYDVINDIDEFNKFNNELRLIIENNLELLINNTKLNKNNFVEYLKHMKPIMTHTPYELLSEIELINIVNLIALCNETKDFFKLLKDYNFSIINCSDTINGFFLFDLLSINEKALNNFNKKKYKLAINKRINDISIDINEDEKRFLKELINFYDMVMIMNKIK